MFGVPTGSFRKTSPKEVDSSRSVGDIELIYLVEVLRKQSVHGSNIVNRSHERENFLATVRIIKKPLIVAVVGDRLSLIPFPPSIAPTVFQNA